MTTNDGEGMTSDLIKTLLRPGYENGDGTAEGAQLVDLAWYHPVMGCDSLQIVVDNARAVLARYGRPATIPIPVSDRLPGPEECDAEGKCWWWIVDQPGEFPYWIFAHGDVVAWAGYTHWLPYWALPLPIAAATVP